MSRFDAETPEEERKAEIAQDINTIHNHMANKDDHYQKLFDKIEKETEMLEDSELSLKKRYEVLLSVDFVLIRLRMLVSGEQVKVKKIINSKDTPTAWIPLFRNRDVHLASVHQKLMEIRGDIEVIQKMVYAWNTYNLRS